MYHRSRGIRLLALLVVLPCALVLLFAQTASAQSEPGGDPYENSIALLQETLSTVRLVLEQEKEDLKAAQAALDELSDEADPATVRSYQKTVDDHAAEVQRLEGIEDRIEGQIDSEFARLFEPVIPDGPHAPPVPEPPDPTFVEIRLLAYEQAKEDTAAADAEVERLRALGSDKPEEENLKLQDALNEKRKAEERERRLAEGYKDYAGEDAEEALARKQANEAAGAEGTITTDTPAAPEPGPTTGPSFWTRYVQPVLDGISALLGGGGGPDDKPAPGPGTTDDDTTDDEGADTTEEPAATEDVAEADEGQGKQAQAADDTAQNSLADPEEVTATPEELTDDAEKVVARPGGVAQGFGQPARRPGDPVEPDQGDLGAEDEGDGRSNMSIEPIPGFGGGPNGDGPCTLPESLRVFCPPGLEEPPATDLPDIFTKPPTDIGKPHIFVPPPDDLPGKSGGRTGGGTTDGGLEPGVLPGGQSGPCPGGKDILVTCPIGDLDGTGSTIRLGTGTVTLDPKTKGDLTDLFDKPDTNPYATAPAPVPVVPFAPGLLLPKVAPVQTQIDLDAAAGPTLFGSLDTFTLNGTGGSDGLGAGDGQIGGGDGQSGDSQPPEGDQGGNQGGDCQASDPRDCPSEVPAPGTGAATGVAGEAVGGVGEGAASSVGGGTGQPGTVEPDAGVTDEQVTTPEAGAGTEAPIVCDPGMPC